MRNLQCNKNIEGCVLIKSEIKSVLTDDIVRLSQYRPDDIVKEVLTALNNLEIDKIKVTKEMYDSGKILEDLNTSSFITLPKKSGKNEYKFRQTVRLISHITNL